MNPTVTVVIPTRHRTKLLERAVRTALAQTVSDIEVIAVIDGRDDETEAFLRTVRDPRLRVEHRHDPVGGSEARNIGARSGSGRWVAFLDDDDEWLPKKLERQLALAGTSPYPRPVVSSLLIARSPRGDEIRPHRLPKVGEDLSEYLIVRDFIFPGTGLLQTSTLMAPRSLLDEVPFRAGLKRHQDWDWILRAVRAAGVGLEVVPEPLAVWYIEEQRPATSSHEDWRASVEWADANRNLVTPRAYSSLLLTVVGPLAARQHSARDFCTLLHRAIREGDASPRDCALYAGMWLVPVAWRRNARKLATAMFRRDRFRPGGSGAP